MQFQEKLGPLFYSASIRFSQNLAWLSIDENIGWDCQLKILE